MLENKKKWKMYTRRCKRCDQDYKSYSRRSHICPKCCISPHTEKNRKPKDYVIHNFIKRIREIKEEAERERDSKIKEETRNGLRKIKS